MMLAALQVLWSTTCGTITQTGIYTAPSVTSGRVCTVTATARGQTAQAFASVTPLELPPAVTRTLAAGLWNYPPDSYCNTLGLTGIAQSFAPSTLLGHLQAAQRCGVRLVVIPLRPYVTAGGVKGSPFSLDSAKALTDRIAKILPPDTLKKYDPYIIGMNLADDYGCASCWGGQSVSQSMIANWAAYIRQKIPGLRIGVRVEPTWVQSSPTLAGLIDYAWAQYHTGKGDAKTYFDKHAGIANSLGIALAMGVNVKYCGGAGTASCTPTQVRTFMGLAAGYPENCALLGWEYTNTTLAQAGMVEAWADVLTLAKSHPDVPCRRP